MGFKKFMSFERMVTPVIIRILFWISLVIVVLGAIIAVIAGVISGIRDESVGIIIASVLAGPVILVGGILGVRVYAELLILAFRINETLTDIKTLLQKQE